ncbi:MAG: antibiotic acetyltransferase, partial [Gemmatimonadota bacterium]
YGAVVLAGVHVGVQGMVGARAVATRDVRPYHVNVGIPAKSVRVKSIAPPSAQPDVNRPESKGWASGREHSSPAVRCG